MNQLGSAQMIFGFHPVMEALQAGTGIDKIMIHREAEHQSTAGLITLARSKGVEIQKVPLSRLNLITRKNHQGIIAWISQISYASLENIIANCFESAQMPLVLVLDRITDVRNLGAIARTAEAAGVHALVVPSKGSAQINSDAIKASAGALMHVPVCKEAHLEQSLRYLKDCGLRLIAATERGSTGLFEADFTGPLAIILGSEEDGISSEILRVADELVAIPMAGSIGSLNVSVSAGVLLYQALRARKES
jgi:23S rRNA (guanosine2251-2'-O)-methyltransferase